MQMLIQFNIVNINVSRSSGFAAIERLWCMLSSNVLCASLCSPKHTDMHRLRAALLPEPVTSEQLWTEQSDTEGDGLIKRNFTTISLVLLEQFSFDLCYFLPVLAAAGIP